MTVLAHGGYWSCRIALLAPAVISLIPLPRSLVWEQSVMHGVARIHSAQLPWE